MSSPNDKPPRRTPYSRQFGMVMELPFALVSAVLVGGGIGYFLDRWLGTSPFLMLILGGLGFYAGLREVMRRLDHAQGKRSGNESGERKPGGHDPGGPAGSGD
ncbi:MAG TPA: AtpZ/AtpI family protein [Candidatus Acidoferrales bacterium]